MEGIVLENCGGNRAVSLNSCFFANITNCLFRSNSVCNYVPLYSFERGLKVVPSSWIKCKMCIFPTLSS